MPMKETTWIIDSRSGALTVEGMSQAEVMRLTADILPTGTSINCSRPINLEPLRISSAHIANAEHSLRRFRIYHDSVVEGPGCRSAVGAAGCLWRCLPRR